jgi:SAM-dependent methyltransferase
MSQHSDTIRYYDEHADDYIRGTIELDMQSLYKPFLDLLPRGGSILDAGCGSGRDSKAFMDLGYSVTAIDASKRMVAATTQLTGQQARQMRFQDCSFVDEFDGIWASLLHIARRELGDVLERIVAAMRPNGICYASFKEGDGERSIGGRQFTSFTLLSLETSLAIHPNLVSVRIWTTNDLSPGSNSSWVNALVRKKG